MPVLNLWQGFSVGGFVAVGLMQLVKNIHKLHPPTLSVNADAMKTESHTSAVQIIFCRSH
jgi:hypothetical protein